MGDINRELYLRGFFDDTIRELYLQGCFDDRIRELYLRGCFDDTIRELYLRGCLGIQFVNRFYLGVSASLQSMDWIARNY